MGKDKKGVKDKNRETVQVNESGLFYQNCSNTSRGVP
jgi:hypothetical protein